MGERRFLEGLRTDLRSGAYHPSPFRRVLIPKTGKPGAFRPLGVPAVKDRVVQGAIKIILEPIFEAQFWRVSYGFRPGRSAHGALEHIRHLTLSRNVTRTDVGAGCPTAGSSRAALTTSIITFFWRGSARAWPIGRWCG
ncbi:MAG: reverse transcriptase domain-containing protein [Geminicoccaceae bacterium]